MRFLVFAVFALLLMANSAFSDHAHENQVALRAYNSGDYATAFNIWIKEAEKGDAVAQTTIGAMYMHGKGTETDFVQAAKWHRMAAE